MIVFDALSIEYILQFNLQLTSRICSRCSRRTLRHELKRSMEYVYASSVLVVPTEKTSSTLVARNTGERLHARTGRFHLCWSWANLPGSVYACQEDPIIICEWLRQPALLMAAYRLMWRPRFANATACDGQYVARYYLHTLNYSTHFEHVRDVVDLPSELSNEHCLGITTFGGRTRYSGRDTGTYAPQFSRSRPKARCAKSSAWHVG